MTRRISRLALHVDPTWPWVGVCVLERWIVFQPLPCIGISWKRRRAPAFTAKHGGVWPTDG